MSGAQPCQLDGTRARVSPASGSWPEAQTLGTWLWGPCCCPFGPVRPHPYRLHHRLQTRKLPEKLRLRETLRPAAWNTKTSSWGSPASPRRCRPGLQVTSGTTACLRPGHVERACATSLQVRPPARGVRAPLTTPEGLAVPPGPPARAVKARHSVTVQQGDTPALPKSRARRPGRPRRRPPPALPGQVPTRLCLLRS